MTGTAGGSVPEFPTDRPGQRRIVAVSAGLSQPSSTRLLADRLLSATATALGAEGADVQTESVELRELAHDITDRLLTGFASPRLAAVLESIERADALIAVTPIFTTSYSGLFKSFVDGIDPQALTGMPVLLGATGGTERHSLAIDYAMRPVFAYLHADVVATGVYAASSDWGGPDALAERIDRAGAELAAAVARTVRQSGPRDPFALPAGFDPSGLGGLAG